MPPKKGGKAAGKGKGKGGGKGGGKKGGPTIIDGVRSFLDKIIWCWEAAKVFPGSSQRDVSGPAGRARAQVARGAAEGEGRAELLPAGEGPDRHLLGGDSQGTGGDESRSASEGQVRAAAVVVVDFHLLLLLRELEESEERHMMEVKVYKQKVKHLLYEQENNIAELKAENMVSRNQNEFSRSLEKQIMGR